ncbi:MAG: 3-dehydroquinate synthase [Clostridia bacterium]|nr:3-dehydroquinate synthase [Clostridia bacterium]
MLSLDVRIPKKEYKIYLQNGLYNCMGELLEGFVKNKKVCVVSDTNVFPLYGNVVEEAVKEAGGDVFSLAVKAGEEAKSFENLEYLCREIIRSNFTRSDVIIALGGGVVGDLTAFCASVVLRGVTLIQMPTTLLSQVDSSVGGKTAVNIPEGKNLVGTFYQPKAVFIDTKTLETLPEREVACGMAEVIKYGAIRDNSLAQKLLTGEYEIGEVIKTCCSIKAGIVENDELDKGERMLLNFGHTLGHAVENYTGYGTYSHGAAVAIGMCAITKWSENKGITKKGTYNTIKLLCEKYNLPTQIENLDKMTGAAMHDKKRSGNKISIVLIKQMGESYYEKVDVSLLNEIAREV